MFIILFFVAYIELAPFFTTYNLHLKTDAGVVGMSIELTHVVDKT